MGLFQLVERAAYLSYLVHTIYKSAWALSSRQQHLLLAPTRLQSPSHDRNKLGAGLNLPLGGSIKRLPSWNPSGMMMAALQQLQLQGSNPWVLNTGTSPTCHHRMVYSNFTPFHSSIIVGNSNSFIVLAQGHSLLPTSTSTFHLGNVLVVPSLVRNLLFVHQFNRDNLCSIKFAPLVSLLRIFRPYERCSLC